MFSTPPMVSLTHFRVSCMTKMALTGGVLNMEMFLASSAAWVRKSTMVGRGFMY